MNNYLLATGLYALNADGSWPRFAVQYFWETWCGMFALYCLKQSGVPGLRYGMRSDNNYRWGIVGDRARLATADGKGGFKFNRGGGAAFPATGDVGIKAGAMANHHFILWLPKSDGNRLTGFNCIDGNGLPEGALPVYMDTQTGKAEAPPCQMLGNVRKYLNGYIAKTYRPIEEIGAIYSLDLDGLQ